MSEKREHNILEAGRRAIHSVGLEFSDDIKAFCAHALRRHFKEYTMAKVPPPKNKQEC